MSTRTWYAVFGVVSLLIVAAVILFLTQNKSDDQYHAPASQPPGKGVVGKAALDTDSFDTTITYTDNGFSPADITIAQGTRVRFINKSKQAFWPAVGVHPTHTLYPEKENTDCLGSAFDACQDLQPGEFFDFTFYYVGNWPYHDHLHAYDTGTITVTASSTTSK